MTRDKIKNIVYDYASEQFDNIKEFTNKIMMHSNNGEDLLLYNEIGFDSLDTIELIMKIESDEYLNCKNLPNELFDNEITLGKIIDYIWKQNQN